MLAFHFAFRCARIGVCATAVLSHLLPAQSTKAEIYGTVRDAMGRTVPSATVELLGHGDAQRARYVTSVDGAYFFLALPAGRYRVDILAEGFAPLCRDGIVLRVGDRLAVDFQLTVGDAAQTIEVTAATDVLKVSRGSVGFVVEQEKVATLPLDGRNFVPLIALAPGVSLPPGSPIAVTQATNLNAFAGFGIQRPNRSTNPALPAGGGTTGRWFNTAAFYQAPQFTIGDSSRNPVSGPGYRTADLMAGKSVTLREGIMAEFRAEAFNVTNTPPLGNPNGSFGNPAFGTITTALDPRIFEFVLKLRF